MVGDRSGGAALAERLQQRPGGRELGGSQARDAFAGITELVDQQNATTGEQDVGKGELGLIEIEFYEAVSS